MKGICQWGETCQFYLSLSQVTLISVWTSGVKTVLLRKKLLVKILMLVINARCNRVIIVLL